MTKMLNNRPPSIQLTEQTQTLIDWERQLEVEFEQWGNSFVQWARECGAVIQETGIDYRIALDKLQASLAASAADGQGKDKHVRLMDRFRQLSSNSNGYMASYSSTGNVLWLSKPGSAWTEKDIGS